MKKVLAFDIDQTLNVAKTPIPNEIADLLIDLLEEDFLICPISGQKFDQFKIQIVDRLVERGATADILRGLHLFVAQGTQYYRYSDAKTWSKGPVSLSIEMESRPYDETKWQLVYDFPLSKDEAEKITSALETSAKKLGFWEEDKLADGDEIIENRLSQVTFSALGQRAGTEAKYAWDPDHKKRDAIVKEAKKLAPEFDYEVGGTTNINAFHPGMNKKFGMEHLMEELDVDMDEILYFGDMTQKGGNDYPVVEMGIETITVRSHEDTAYALRGILGVL